MNWGQSGATRRRPARRPAGRRQPVRRDAVFSAMLAQITVCLVLLALAYCLQLSGLDWYASVRSAADRFLSEELDLSGINSAMSRWNVQIPVWSGQKDQPKDAPESQPEPEGPEGAASKPEAEPEPENTGEASQVIDQELAQYIEKYLPSAPTEPDPERDPLAGTDLEESLNGRGGGVNPVRLVGTEPLTPPEGMLLSPFFLTERPILPVSYGVLTCRFGYRVHPLTGKDDFHTGVDIASEEGANISAVLPGTVSEVGVSEIYGDYVVVQHSKGFETAYCHCSQILAPVGAVVRQGEVIAKVGSTGWSTGSHVHLEFRLNGMRANPAWVYDAF